MLLILILLILYIIYKLDLLKNDINILIYKKDANNNTKGSKRTWL